MALYTDEGIVLRTQKLGEADRIITLLTRDHGKVRAVAHGVRRPKSRFGGRLEPFVRSSLLLAQGRSLDVVSQASTLSAWGASFITNIDAYTAASVISEVAERLTAEHQPSPDHYQLLMGALCSLSKRTHHPVHVALSFVLRALAISGWQMRYQECALCGIKSPLVAMSVSHGGALCADDAASSADATRLDATEMSQVTALLEGNWLVLDSAQISMLVRTFVEKWGEYYLDSRIRSLDLLGS